MALIDPSIPLSVRPMQVPSIVDMRNQAMSLKDMAQQRQVRNLQIQGAERDLQTAKQADEKTALYRDAVRRHTTMDDQNMPVFDDAAIRAELAQSPYPELADQYRVKILEDLELGKREFQAKTDDARKLLVDLAASKAKQPIWAKLRAKHFPDLPEYYDEALIPQIKEELDWATTTAKERMELLEKQLQIKKLETEATTAAATQAEKEARATAGELVPGTENLYTIDGKPQRGAMFRVRQKDGAFVDELRAIGEPAAPARAPVPGTDIPLPKDVEAQRTRIAAANRVDPEQVVTYTDGGTQKIGILNKRTHQIEPLRTPTGAEAGAPDTADMRNKEAGRQRGLTFISRMEDLSQKLIKNKTRVEQLMNAIARGGTAAVASDPDYRAYQSFRKSLAASIGTMEQGARISDVDVKEVYLPMIPDLFSDTDDSAELKWELIYTKMGMDRADVADAGETEKRITEAMIQDTMKANPNATREQVIEAFKQAGYQQ